MKKYFLIIILIITAQSNKNDKIETIDNKQDSFIYGVTLDSINNINSTIDSINSLPKKITTRIVFDKVPAKNYANAINKLSKNSDIMGELFDSEYIKDYTFKEYKKRVNEYMDMYGDKIEIWEIGNEVNGEWTGKPSVVAKKTIYGFEEAKRRNYKTALTLYYNDYSYKDGCWLYPDEKMRDWATTRLTDEIKNGIDFLFISYYEEDCNNYKPKKDEWEKVFSDLGTIFPHAKLGFGEVGASKSNKKSKYLKKYYTLNIKHPRYIGGYFWWYFKEDMVPKSKPLWSVFNKIIRKLKYKEVNNAKNVERTL